MKQNSITGTFEDTRKSSEAAKNNNTVEETENPWILAETTRKPSKNQLGLSKQEKQMKELRARTTNKKEQEAEEEDIDLTETLQVEKKSKVIPKKTSNSDIQARDNEDDEEDFSIKQRILIERAFAADNVIEKDFEDEKKALIESLAPKESQAIPGWVPVSPLFFFFFFLFSLFFFFFLFIFPF